MYTFDTCMRLNISNHSNTSHSFIISSSFLISKASINLKILVYSRFSPIVNDLMQKNSNNQNKKNVVALIIFTPIRRAAMLQHRNLY